MTAIAAAAFAVFGALLVAPGALQAAFAREFAVGMAATGGLAAALLGGMGVGVVASGPLVDRGRRGPLFVASALLAALGCLGAAAAGSLAGAALALAVGGGGAGALETVLNASVAERDPLRAPARLAVLHAATTAGAVLAPPGLARLAQAGGRGPALLALAAACAGVAALGLFARIPPPLHPRPARRVGPAAPPGATLGAALVPLALASALYVGCETALGVLALPWAAALGLDAERGSLALSGFWLGLLLSRVAFAVLRRPAGAGFMAGCAAAAALGLALAGGWGRSSPELWLLAVGLACGPIFPVLVATTVARFPQRAGAATGIVVGAGSIGGFGLPPLAGAIGDAAGASVAVASLAVVGLAFAAAALAARPARRR